MILDLLMFNWCYLSGLFFGVMIFTIIENASKGFRQFVRRLCQKIPFLYRRIIMWVMLLLMGFIGFQYLPWGITLNGLSCGLIGGIFMYFKAGVTMGNNPDPYNQQHKKKMKQLKKK